MPVASLRPVHQHETPQRAVARVEVHVFVNVRVAAPITAMNLKAELVFIKTGKVGGEGDIVRYIACPSWERFCYERLIVCRRCTGNEIPTAR